MYMGLLPSNVQVKFWVWEFNCGRLSLEDEAKLWRQLEATDEKKCMNFCDRVHSDRRKWMEEIAKAVDISHCSVSTILHDCLRMCKLLAHWVPKSLSAKQMATPASVCSSLPKQF